MLVKELIEQLKKFNPNANISLRDSESIYISYICANGENPNNTLQVFLEGCDFCDSCQFFDDGFCRVYDKNCDDVIECFQYIEEE